MRGKLIGYGFLFLGNIVAMVAIVLVVGRLGGWPWGAWLIVVLIAVGAWEYLAIFRPMWRTVQVLKRGALGEATVLEVWDTGQTVKNDPQVGLRLLVRPSSGMPFEAKTKSVVSRLVVGQLQPGAVVQVRYDAQDPRRVVVLPDAVVRSAARGAAERLEELEALRVRRLVTEEEYRRKRQEILNGV